MSTTRNSVSRTKNTRSSSIRGEAGKIKRSTTARTRELAVLTERRKAAELKGLTRRELWLDDRAFMEVVTYMIERGISYRLPLLDSNKEGHSPAPPQAGIALAGVPHEPKEPHLSTATQESAGNGGGWPADKAVSPALPVGMPKTDSEIDATQESKISADVSGPRSQNSIRGSGNIHDADGGNFSDRLLSEIVQSDCPGADIIAEPAKKDLSAGVVESTRLGETWELMNLSSAMGRCNFGFPCGENRLLGRSATIERMIAAPQYPQMTLSFIDQGEDLVP